MRKDKIKTVCVCMPAEEVAILKTVQVAENRTFSNFVRNAIDYYMRHEKREVWQSTATA